MIVCLLRQKVHTSPFLSAVADDVNMKVTLAKCQEGTINEYCNENLPAMWGNIGSQRIFL